MVALLATPFCAKAQDKGVAQDTVKGNVPENVDPTLKLKTKAGVNNVSMLMINGSTVSMLNNTYLSGSASTTLGEGFKVSFNATELINAKSSPVNVNINAVSVACNAVLTKTTGAGDFEVTIGRLPTQLANFTAVPNAAYVSENFGAGFINITDNMSITYRTKDGKGALQFGWITDVSNEQGHAFGFILNPECSDVMVKAGIQGLKFGGADISASLGGRLNKDDIKTLYASIAAVYGNTGVSVGGSMDKDGAKDWATISQQIRDDMSLVASAVRTNEGHTVAVSLDKSMKKGKMGLYAGYTHASVSDQTASTITTTTSTSNVFGGVTYTIGGGTASRYLGQANKKSVSYEADFFMSGNIYSWAKINSATSLSSTLAASCDMVIREFIPG